MKSLYICNDWRTDSVREEAGGDAAPPPAADRRDQLVDLSAGSAAGREAGPTLLPT
jgi:hypothetical protein